MIPATRPIFRDEPVAEINSVKTSRPKLSVPRTKFWRLMTSFSLMYCLLSMLWTSSSSPVSSFFSAIIVGTSSKIPSISLSRRWYFFFFAAIRPFCSAFGSYFSSQRAIRPSATLRISLAFCSVVTIFPWYSRDVTCPLIRAFLWSAVLLSFL